MIARLRDCRLVLRIWLTQYAAIFHDHHGNKFLADVNWRMAADLKYIREKQQLARMKGRGE